MGRNTLVTYSKTIAATGTPEAIVKDAEDPGDAKPLVVQSFRVGCPAGNTSDLTIGDTTTQLYVIPKGEDRIFENPNPSASKDDGFDLRKWFVKAGTNGDVAIIARLEKVD